MRLGDRVGAAGEALAVRMDSDVEGARLGTEKVGMAAVAAQEKVCHREEEIDLAEEQTQSARGIEVVGHILRSLV